MRPFSIILVIVALSMTLCTNAYCQGSADWAMWRYDANRSASSPHKLSDNLNLLWVHEYPKLNPTWDDPLNQDLMQFGKAYEPIVIGDSLFIGSSSSDWVKALDTNTGEEKWTFYTDAPVRLPLVADKGMVYFTSDDGNLYCMDADQGNLIWKFQGGPSDRKVLGNERIISTWPARGGVVLRDDIIYFAAGIWPFMGIFIYALDAKTGAVIWANDSTGPIYMLQPHNSPSYAGVAPQGALAVIGDRLLVPCGRSVPACFNRHTGEMLYYHLANYNKSGGAFVAGLNDIFVNYYRDYVTSIYNLGDGSARIPRFGKIPVLTDEALYSMGNEVIAYGLYKEIKYTKKENKDKKTEMVKVDQWRVKQLWKCSVDASGDLIKSGERLYAGGRGVISAIDIPQDESEPIISWKVLIDGTVSRLISANNKLFAVTLEGNIFAFGEDEVQPIALQHIPEKTDLPENIIQQAKSILEGTGINEGYCLAYGVGSGDLVLALAENSKLRITALDPDPANVERLRRRFDSVGLYGKRLNVQLGDLHKFKSPQYIASLIVFDSFDGDDISYIRDIYPSVRPYGGTICFSAENENPEKIKAIEGMGLEQASVKADRGLITIVKEGPPAGSSDWTHQYGDIANTVKSDDDLVKLPLGLLWFGGNSNMDVLPRHAHGPPEQVIGGRLFIEGIGLMNARDVYTGRILWQKHLPNMDTYNIYYDATYANTPLDTSYNQVHIPGANARGTNFVATIDKVYIAQKESCRVLDARTGERIADFRLPIDPKTNKPAEWGYIGVYKDYLIAGAEFVRYGDFIETEPETDKHSSFYNYDVTSSKKLVIMDKNSGKIIWDVESKLGFRHNAIAIWDDKLFCIDILPNPVYSTLKRRGEEYSSGDVATLYAYDITNGNLIWSDKENIFGTWLGYSKEYDILIQAARNSRDMIRGEPNRGMRAYNAKDGEILWSSDVAYGGPIMIHDRTLITDRYAYNLLTGEQEMREDPITGEKTPWEFKRNYGCNYVIASEHLLTFRSAAAGFFDLNTNGGTGNFGGFKSGCTSNLISAGGVLNAPDYTRTCSCSYQNQTSLAMVYDPDVEIWTDYPSERINKPVKKVGINFSAPGSRMADDGVLWLEYPLVGGPSPSVPISIVPKDYVRFTNHSSKIQGEELKWVVASGIKGVSSIKISLAGAETENIQERPYTIRLYFSEPDDLTVNQRVFDVAIQGQKVINGLDIIKEAGGKYRPIVKEFRGIKVKDDLKLNFDTINGNGEPSIPLICGIEIVAEK